MGVCCAHREAESYKDSKEAANPIVVKEKKTIIVSLTSCTSNKGKEVCVCVFVRVSPGVLS